MWVAVGGGGAHSPVVRQADDRQEAVPHAEATCIAGGREELEVVVEHLAPCEEVLKHPLLQRDLQAVTDARSESANNLLLYRSMPLTLGSWVWLRYWSDSGIEPSPKVPDELLESPEIPLPGSPRLQHIKQVDALLVAIEELEQKRGQRIIVVSKRSQAQHALGVKAQVGRAMSGEGQAWDHHCILV